MEKKVGHSPSINVLKSPPLGELDFPQAMREVIEGKKIARAEWEDRLVYGFLNGEFLSLHKADGRNYQWIVNDGDLFGRDWEVVVEGEVKDAI